MARNNRTDRFGNETALAVIKKKGDFGIAYFEFGNQLFKIDISPARKEGIELWAKITKLRSRRGGGGMMGGY